VFIARPINYIDPTGHNKEAVNQTQLLSEILQQISQQAADPATAAFESAMLGYGNEYGYDFITVKENETSSFSDAAAILVGAAGVVAGGIAGLGY